MIGNLYGALGGRDTKYWLCVSIKKARPGGIHSDRAVMLGLDADFNIISAACYGTHALKKREVLAQLDINQVRFDK